MRKIFLFLSIYLTSISRGTSQRIEKDTKKYFKSASYQKCQEYWKKYRVGYENTLATALKAGYGHQTMNVYIKRPKDALLLNTGYYHSDNQVGILFQEVLLEEFPSLLNPEISFDLCGNALSIESSLSKMIIHSDYFLFRNRSDIIYSSNNQDSSQSSPFLFQQVQNTGQIAITAEKCLIYGTVFTKLDGQTVTVGFDMLQLRNCEFSVDVYTPGQKTPPVLASYIFDRDGPHEKNILVKALSKELMAQLQAALFTHVNTSAIFGKDLIYVEHNEKVIIVEVEAYIDNVLRKINMQTIENNMGTINLNDFSVKWTDAFDGSEQDCSIHLSCLKMSGLDLAYSAHIGGPYNIEGTSVKIAERVRMSNLQVLGVITLKGMYVGDYRFAADIYDVDIDMILDVETLEEKYKGNNAKKGSSGHKFIVSGWRTLEFSCPDVEELPIETIVTGYLLDELPGRIVAPLINVYKYAVPNYFENDNSSKTEEVNNDNCNKDNAAKEDKSMAGEDDEMLVGKDYDKVETDDSNIILHGFENDVPLNGNEVEGDKDIDNVQK